MPIGGSAGGYVSWGPNPAKPYKNKFAKGKGNIIDAFKPMGKRKKIRKKNK